MITVRDDQELFLESANKSNQKLQFFLENLMISGFDFLSFEWTHVSKRELTENLITRIEEQLKGDTLEGQHLQECVQMVGMS